MELDDKTIQGTVRTLHHVRTSPMVKLNWGRIRRQMDRDAAARGEPVTGYRAEWLRNTRDRVWEVLKSCGEDFNDKYTFDRASVRDYMDVLKNIHYQLEQVLKRTR